MNDCGKAEFRDRLPDLINERLDGESHAGITSHVGECGDCQEELELLRLMRRSLLAQSPRVDVAAIVAALPPAPVPGVIPIRSAMPKRRWVDWRVAAAVTFIAAGAGSIAVYQGSGSLPPTTAVSRHSSAGVTHPESAVVVAAAAAPPSATPVASTASAAVSPTTAATVIDDDLGNSGDARLAGLNESQLRTLLDDIDHFDALPVSEPEPVRIPVNSVNSNTPAGVR